MVAPTHLSLFLHTIIIVLLCRSSHLFFLPIPTFSHFPTISFSLCFSLFLNTPFFRWRLPICLRFNPYSLTLSKFATYKSLTFRLKMFVELVHVKIECRFYYKGCCYFDVCYLPTWSYYFIQSTHIVTLIHD